LQPGQIERRARAAQIIDNRNLLATGEEIIGQITTNKTGATGDEMCHGMVFPPKYDIHMTFFRLIIACLVRRARRCMPFQSSYQS
jgi:hypothetical protein